MKKQEFANLAAALKSVYQRENFMNDSAAVTIWYELLSDIPYEVLADAVKNYIRNEVFPPTISDLRHYANVITGKDWSIAWNKLKHGAKLSEIDYPGQYAYATIGKAVFDAGRDIRVMLEFQRLYKVFLLMDKQAKSDIFLSGLLTWRKDKGHLEQCDDHD